MFFFEFLVCFLLFFSLLSFLTFSWNRMAHILEMEEFNLMIVVSSFFFVKKKITFCDSLFFSFHISLDVARLMIQCLRSMVPPFPPPKKKSQLTPNPNSQGHSKSASCLEEECGLKVEEENVQALRESILGGDWEGALRALEGLKATQENHVRLKYVILRQKYLELLEV